jgi:hypothetical protein
MQREFSLHFRSRELSRYACSLRHLRLRASALTPFVPTTAGSALLTARLRRLGDSR